MTTNIYMVRHAESHFVFGAERERGLSAEGFEEAKRVAEYFTKIEIHHLVASTYTRAIQTIQHIADQKSLPIEQYQELDERAIKGLDYKAPWEELLEAIRLSFIDKDYALLGGETTRSAQQRSIPIIKKLLEQQQGRNIVIGTHGNIMTIMMNYYDEAYGYDFWHSTSKPDIYLMVFNDQQLERIERVWQ